VCPAEPEGHARRRHRRRELARVAHTSELDAATLAAARSLLEGVFEGELTDQDWEHALGGIHALAWDGGELVGHASIVQRRLLHGGRALRAGYVEGVGVRADHRRRGIGAELMDGLETVARNAYEIAALGTTDSAEPFYTARGWQPWRGPLKALTPAGVVPTPDEHGGIYVLPTTANLDLDADLTCDYRDGDLW
jgi:aminoglycoside 2'-N-acetyltransferase I